MVDDFVDDDDDDDDDDDNLSGFLLGLATSRAALGGSLASDFTTDGIARAGNTLLAFVNRFLRNAGEHVGSILLTPKPQGTKKMEDEARPHGRFVLTRRCGPAPRGVTGTRGA